ncbi:acyltransferase family protein [Spirosoma aerophilum]
MTSQTTSTYLANLTPLRGIAALIVLFFHFDLYWSGPFAGALLNPTQSHFAQKGYIEVDFFFVLSGFIMCHVYGDSFSASVTRAGFWQFMKARFARIYPLHLFTLIWSILLFIAILSINFPLDEREKSVFNLWTIPAHLAMLQGFGVPIGYTWNGPAWTIGVEWWMYIAFPFLYGPVSRLPRWGQVAVLAGLLGGYVVLIYVFNTFPQFPWPNSLNVLPILGLPFLRCVLSFSVGMVFYSLFRQQWGRAWLANGYATLGFAALMGLSMHLGWSDLVTVSTFPFIILSAAYGSTRLNKVLTTKPMQQLGDLSFSIYLTNELVFQTGRVVRHAWGLPIAPEGVSYAGIWLWFFGWLTVVILVSALTYHFIELPARKALNIRFKKAYVSAPNLQPA